MVLCTVDDIAGVLSCRNYLYDTVFSLKIDVENYR